MSQRSEAGSPKLKPGIVLREMWRRRYRSLLNSIFEECAFNKIVLGPDQAMAWMEELLEGIVTSGKKVPSLDEATPPQFSTFRFDFDAFRREAHHYAVDRFYRTYFPRKRGAPSLPTAYLDQILRLRRKGLGNGEIARELGQTKDNIRKQISTAEKRWQDAVYRIEQIRRAFPHVVAQDPRKIHVRTKRAFKQSSRRRKHDDAGK